MGQKRPLRNTHMERADEDFDGVPTVEQPATCRRAATHRKRPRSTATWQDGTDCVPPTIGRCVATCVPALELRRLSPSPDRCRAHRDSEPASRAKPHTGHDVPTLAELDGARSL